MAEILKGSVAADAILARSAEQVKALKSQGVEPTLALIRVGDRSADGAYERGARKRAEAVGIVVRTVDFPEDVEEASLREAISALNCDNSVHGILMFRPLPKHLHEAALCELIAPAKDVDAATLASLAGVYVGGKTFAPCTAQAVIEMLDAHGIEIAGKRVCVVGRSQVVGKPAASLLLERNATVTICHSKSEGLLQIMQEADIVVCAVGRPKQFGTECFKPGQVVIDVGINWCEEEGKLVGDVDFDQVEPSVAAISPVPGGVGSVTSAVLLEHVVLAAKKLCDNEE